MNRKFVDVDLEIEAAIGPFDRGDFCRTRVKPVFRDWEERTLAELLEQFPEAVVATGGGSVMREQNRSRMRAFGQIVWLTADADELARRLEADEREQKVRPALTATGVIEEIAHVLARAHADLRRHWPIW